MRVRMKTHITGFRQGRPWPLKGGLVDVGDREGERLIQAGYAEEVNDEAKTEDTGGRPADPPGQDGTPSSRPDGTPSDGQEWPRHVGGPVFELPDGQRISGKAKAEAAYQEWLTGSGKEE